MSKENIDLEKDAKKYEYYFKTLTTKQDRHPNIGMIKVSKKILNKAIKKFNKDKLEKRFLTPKETFQIMGFKLKDFKNLNSKIKENILNKESLYRQSGNSIVVSNLESIFKLILEIEKKDFKNE
jgi:DNA (cytosine-5)-methyltransferase 1